MAGVMAAVMGAYHILNRTITDLAASAESGKLEAALISAEAKGYRSWGGVNS